jgi:outer membrane protein assembly factor BamE (lipoprotein component of BamABCDE complex)
MSAKKMSSRRAAVLTVVGVLVAIAGYLCVGMESYCLIYPGIDTHYTQGFSQRKFAKVQPGMTKAEVLNLLGEPIGGPEAVASSHWSYTRDGKCRWADWAWLGREIVFADDRVVEAISRVYYE